MKLNDDNVNSKTVNQFKNFLDMDLKLKIKDSCHSEKNESWENSDVSNYTKIYIKSQKTSPDAKQHFFHIRKIFFIPSSNLHQKELKRLNLKNVKYREFTMIHCYDTWFLHGSQTYPTKSLPTSHFRQCLFRQNNFRQVINHSLLSISFK
ncbi:hypothetical protein BpHYR1_029118 [Brachionus plicatilis]|uniref:Uncharacterized protein n=1 Tax=Brachionus plicatilis TaxID=10195 RepID=A0A3M7PQN6_BRAPC|nr:hypothetical protein BpHYR1_029118 [Brachionus plicatilis]